MSLRAGLRFLLKDVLFYGAANTALRFVTLLTTPIITRQLATAEYGLVDAAMVLLMLLTSITLLGQDSAVARYLQDSPEREVRARVFSTAFWSSVVVAVLGAALLLGLAAPVGQAWLGASEAAAPLFRLAAIAVPLQVITQHFIALLKWTFRRKQYAVVTLGTAGVTLGAIVICVPVLHLGPEGVLLAHVSAQAGGALIGWWFCRDLLTTVIDRRLIRRLTSFGWPYAVIAVGSMLLVSLDRVFVGRELSVEQLGLYGAGVKAAALMGLAVGGFQIAWGPFAFANFRSPDAPRTFSAVLLLYTGALLALAALLSTFSAPVLELLASARYLGGSLVVGILALALAVNGIQWVTCIGLVVAERTYFTALGYAGGVLAGLALYPVLVPRLGMLGASLGTLGMQLTSTVLVTWFAQRVQPYPYDLRAITLMVVGVGASIVWQSVQAPATTGAEWLLRTAVGAAAVALVTVVLASRFVVVSRGKTVLTFRPVESSLWKRLP